MPVCLPCSLQTQYGHASLKEVASAPALASAGLSCVLFAFYCGNCSYVLLGLHCTSCMHDVLPPTYTCHML